MRMRMAASYGARVRGLLWRKPSWLGDDGVLVLSPCRSVHTFGMGHSIDIAFVDADGVVLRSETAVAPMRVLSCTGAVMVLERFSFEIGEGGDVYGVADSWFKVGDVICLDAGS